MRDLGVAGAAVLAALLGLGVLLWLRGRRLGVASGRIDLRRGFPLSRRTGYAPADVEDVLDRVYELAGSEGGRSRALELLHEAQFGLARRGGYDPVVVDLHVDAMIVARQTGRDLPRRPGPETG